MKILILLFAYLLATESTLHHFKNYSIDQGIPSSEIHQVIQDHEGYIWFATDRGICRYDGHDFRVFTQKDGLPDDVVFGFHLDGLNDLWFYTYNGGLGFYKNGKIVQPEFNGALVNLLSQRPRSIISSLHVNHDYVHVGTYNGHLYQINRITGKITAHHSPKSPKHVKIWNVDSSYSSDFVYCANYIGKNNDIVIEHKSSLPKDSFRLKFLKTNSLPIRAPRVSYLCDSSFIYAEGDAIYKFNPQGLVQHTTLGSEVLNCLVMDEGNLWVGTRDGILCYSNGNLQSKPKRYLSNCQVSSFLHDREGGYWFTTLDKGIMYTPDLNVISIPNAALGNSNLSQILTNDYGVYTRDHKKSTYFFPDGNVDQPQLIAEGNYLGNRIKYTKDQKIVSYEDRLVWRIFSGKESALVTEFTETFFQSDPGSPSSWDFSNPPLLKVYSFEHDSIYTFKSKLRITAVTATPSFNQVFIGTYFGLLVFKKNQNDWSIDTLNSVSHVTDLDLIDDKHVLISTRGKGALILNTRDNTLKEIKAIPNKHCHKSLIDNNGNIWLASYTGIYKITSPLKKATITSYSSNDGLISNDVNDIVLYKNKIWMTSSKGISVFDTNWVPKSSLGHGLKITNVQINHENTPVLGSYRLNHYQNNIAVNTNVISFMRPLKIEYKMTGLQEDWITTENHNITFSDLKPGDYSLFLRVKNQGNTAASLKVIHFKILPPIWATAWFITTLTLLLGLTVLIIINTRYKLVQRADKLYQLFVKSEQKALRSQISPHFLFNSLNSLLGLILNKKYELVTPYVLNLSKLMRMTLVHSRKEFVSLEEEIEFLHFYLKVESERFEHKFDYDIDTAPGLDKNESLIPPLLIQPYVENALKHGIAKRTDGNAKIEIKFYTKMQNIIVDIIDNGIGFKTEHIKKKSLGMRINGDRFKLFSNDHTYSIHIDKLSQDSTNPFKGTIIRLAFPLKTL